MKLPGILKIFGLVLGSYKDLTYILQLDFRKLIILCIVFS